jgi:two-component system chemotaxis response regulator CheY
MAARVLVVEDSATVRTFVTAALESAGTYQVTEAPSGFEALKALPREKYDAIITDINMPDINGLELVRFVRESERHAKTPLVIISSDGRDVDRERGLKLGADAYLVKPFSPEELLAVLARLLAPAAPRS